VLLSTRSLSPTLSPLVLAPHQLFSEPSPPPSLRFVRVSCLELFLAVSHGYGIFIMPNSLLFPDTLVTEGAGCGA